MKNRCDQIETRKDVWRNYLQCLLRHRLLKITVTQALKATGFPSSVTDTGQLFWFWDLFILWYVFDLFCLFTQMPLRRPMFRLIGLKAFGGPGTGKRNTGASYLALLQSRASLYLAVTWRSQEDWQQQEGNNRIIKNTRNILKTSPGSDINFSRLWSDFH